MVETLIYVLETLVYFLKTHNSNSYMYSKNTYKNTYETHNKFCVPKHIIFRTKITFVWRLYHCVCGVTLETLEIARQTYLFLKQKS